MKMIKTLILAVTAVLLVSTTSAFSEDFRLQRLTDQDSPLWESTVPTDSLGGPTNLTTGTKDAQASGTNTTQKTGVTPGQNVLNQENSTKMGIDSNQGGYPVKNRPALNQGGYPAKVPTDVTQGEYPAKNRTDFNQGGYPAKARTGSTQGGYPAKARAGSQDESPAKNRFDLDQEEDTAKNRLDPNQDEVFKDGQKRIKKVLPPDVEPELSAIELEMQDTDNGAIIPAPQEREQKKLRSFGYSFFRPDAQGFAPISDIPVGPDYQLGSGDRISLTLWGSIDGTYNLDVNRSGEIIIPRIGPVKVSGVTFGQLPKLISGHLGKVFKDFNLSVTMGKLRMIKVYVVGEVNAPGDYSLSSLSTVINALSAAGGPTRNGSLRSITIRRNGAPAETVDLYDFFLKGDKSRDIRLQPGDSIFVPTIGPVAGITGNVRRPAIYELKGEKSLKDLFALADGVIPSSYLQRLQISRIDAHEKKTVTDVNLDPKSSGKAMDELAASITIKDMDLVKIFPIAAKLHGYVRLEGYVLRPGDYALEPGMKIDQILSLDNLLPEYYTEGGVLVRLVPPDFRPEILHFNVKKALAKEPEHNIELREFDVISIFSKQEMEEQPVVKIWGEVQKPGVYRLFGKMQVRDLLQLGGNPKLTAYLPNAEINRIKRDGASVTSYPININLQAAIDGDPLHNLSLEPYDELMVRKIPNWENEKDRYVTLKGEFLFPGVYPIYKGERLSAVIERAGGFTNRAFLKGAKFTRALVRDVQQKRMDETLIRAEQELTKRQAELASIASSKEELEAGKAALDGLKHNIDQLRSAKAEGRVIVRIASLAKLKKSREDVEMMAGDMLEVPQSPNAVNVMGYVYNPTSMLPAEDETVTYYLDKTGGPTRDAESDEIYIIRADGSVESRQQSSTLAGLFGGGFYSKTIEVGDTIVVPQKIERTAWLRNIKDITTIISQIALTAGTVLIGLK